MIFTSLGRKQAGFDPNPVTTSLAHVFHGLLDLVDGLLGDLLDLPIAWSVLPSVRSSSLPVNAPVASLIRPFTTSAVPLMIATPVASGCWKPSVKKKPTWLNTLRCSTTSAYSSTDLPDTAGLSFI